MRSSHTAFVVLILLVLLSGISFVWDTPVEFFENIIGKNPKLGALIFVAVMFMTTVVAPLTSLPLVPLISPVLGPALTAFLSILGWTIGAVVAFLIARHAGRPLLAKFVSLESIDRYEQFIPREARFLTVVALRMVIPVDILSYALGVFSRISLIQYTVATVLGISWFAIAFSYLGSAASSSDLALFSIFGAISIVVFGLSWFYVVQQVRKKKE